MIRSLLTTLSASVNLTVANHVHILEPHWNPMAEAQAVDRVHRIGQRWDVLITRYLIKDSIEFVSAALGTYHAPSSLGCSFVSYPP